MWHESEDIDKKSLFPKFKLILILRFQGMHDYVCFIAPIDYCVEWSLVKTFCENCYFILKRLQPHSFGEMCFFEENYEHMQKSQFWKFWERDLFNIREYAFNPNLPDPFWGCSVSIWSQSHFWRLGKLCI